MSLDRSSVIYHLEESVRRHPYGARCFVLVAVDILSSNVFEGPLVYSIHGVEHVVHACLPSAYHAPVTLVGGPEVCLHLVVPQLVDDESEDLPRARLAQVICQDRTEAAVVVVPLHRRRW